MRQDFRGLQDLGSLKFTIYSSTIGIRMNEFITEAAARLCDTKTQDREEHERLANQFG